MRRTPRVGDLRNFLLSYSILCPRLHPNFLYMVNCPSLAELSPVFLTSIFRLWTITMKTGAKLSSTLQPSFLQATFNYQFNPTIRVGPQPPSTRSRSESSLRHLTYYGPARRSDCLSTDLGRPHTSSSYQSTKVGRLSATRSLLGLGFRHSVKGAVRGCGQNISMWSTARRRFVSRQSLTAVSRIRRIAMSKDSQICWHLRYQCMSFDLAEISQGDWRTSTQYVVRKLYVAEYELCLRAYRELVTAGVDFVRRKP